MTTRQARSDTGRRPTLPRPRANFRVPLFFIWPAALLALSGCGKDGGVDLPAAAHGTSPAQAYEALFSDVFLPVGPDASGGGSFGTWETDAFGMPLFRYNIDQRLDPRASYFTSWGTSRDHWHQLGNDAVTATAHNDGYVQFWHWGRGGKCLNRYEPERMNVSGGFRYVKVADEVWNTLYQPDSFDRFERVFGIGYFEKRTERRGIFLLERTYAPFGDPPLLVSETEVTNRTAAPQEIVLWEYWDFNLYELLVAPIMTAPIGAIFESLRWSFNRNFLAASSWNESNEMLSIDLSLAPGVAAPPREAISIEDFYPEPCLLASLTGRPDFFCSDQRSFFGSGGLDRPDALTRTSACRLLPRGEPDIGQACLAMGKRLQLGPGESARVAYAFGSGPLESVLPWIQTLRQAPERNFQDTMDAWISNRIDFVTPEPEWLRREILWHGYYLPAGAFREDYFSGSIVNQGSAYAYIQGLNGAHRDFALFSMPLVYLRPDLARQILEYTMRSQDAGTGEIPYAHQGYGFTTGALVHEESTDLDLFFLMAVAEYLGATRDFEFLEKPLPFYPLSAGKSGPVRQHIETALNHLERSVGTGPHGLIRAGSGDWNDVLIAFSPHPILTMAFGESNLNTAMACFVFPRLAGVLREVASDIADRLDARAQEFRERLLGEWTGTWMRRGYLGDGTWLGEDQLFLDAQPWALLAELWSPDQTATLLDRIQELLVSPSPAGALCLFPPNPAPYLVQGSDTNGGTWAAVDSWLAWAWSRYDPAQAWDFFLATTLYRHAEAYPEVWYGVWSGPDSYNAFYAERPGETFNWSFTPMTDFPVMNMNRHSGPLLDAIRLAGIEPAGERIRVCPALPFPEFVLRTPLLGAAYLADRHRGTYTPVVQGTFRFSVRLPRDLRPGTWKFLLNGVLSPAVEQNGCLLFEARAEPGRRIVWEILPDPG